MIVFFKMQKDVESGCGNSLPSLMRPLSRSTRARLHAILEHVLSQESEWSLNVSKGIRLQVLYS